MGEGSIPEMSVGQARTGIVRALVDRVASLPAEEQSCIPTIVEVGYISRDVLYADFRSR